MWQYIRKFKLSLCLNPTTLLLGNYDRDRRQNIQKYTSEIAKRICERHKLVAAFGFGNKQTVMKRDLLVDAIH